MLSEINPFLLFILQSLTVFAITLTVTKSSILNCKRQFVITRYEYSKQNGNPCFFHTWWYKMNTCAMCLGFWISIPVILSCPIKYDIIIIIMNCLSTFGINWLLHCVEEYLFYNSEHYKNIKKPEQGE